jgi:NADH:ubiquinone oxidoreductase subunit 3 (subunit A)
MSNTFLAWPPVAMGVMLAAAALLLWVLGRLSVRSKGRPAGAEEPYACGEESPSTMVQPDYGQFIPFAFFFTILHVVALMVTTAAMAGMASLVIAAVYVMGAAVGLTVLYGK